MERSEDKGKGVRFAGDDVRVFPAQRLGGGSYSSVLCGVVRATKEPVAIKATDKKSIQRSRSTASGDPWKEASLLSTLPSHPSVVGYYGYWEDDVVMYLVMEKCSGGTLADYIKRVGGQPHQSHDTVTRRLMAELLVGLQHLEGHGIVHQDLKPSNLLLTDDIHLKIADFGAAVRLGSMETGFAGTPEYASPELLQNGECSGHASDLWGMGCVLYEVYIAATPFAGAENEVELFKAIQEKPVTFPPYFPQDAKDLAAMLLLKDPSERIASAGAGYCGIHSHGYFSNVDWANLHDMCNVTESNADYTSKWQQFLYRGETVLHSGTITKTRHIFTHTRTLVLTDLPRLFYFDPASNEVKGTIPLNADVWASAESATELSIHTPKRVFVMQDQGGQAYVWAGKVNLITRKDV